MDESPITIDGWLSHAQESVEFGNFHQFWNELNIIK